MAVGGSVQDTRLSSFIIGLLWVIVFIMVYPPDFDSRCERFFHRQVHRPFAVYLTVSLWNGAVEVRNLEDIHGISMNYVDASNVKLSILQRIWEIEAGHLIDLKAFQPLVVNSFYILLSSSCSFFPPRETGRRCGALYRWCSLANGWFQKQLFEQISAETSIIHGLVSEQRHMSFGDWKASAIFRAPTNCDLAIPCTFLSKASKEVFPCFRDCYGQAQDWKRTKYDLFWSCFSWKSMLMAAGAMTSLCKRDNDLLASPCLPTLYIYMYNYLYTMHNNYM